MIFLSFATEDEALAHRVAATLEQAGFRAYLAHRDLEPGAAWREALVDALRRSSALVHVGSARAQQSAWCNTEVGFALAMGVTIVPLVLSGRRPHPPLAHLQAVVADPDDDASLTAGLAQLVKRLSADFGPPDASDADANPYPGLSPFDARRQGLYAGREEEILAGDRAIQQLVLGPAPRLLLLTGPSGSGKTSLLRAGWVPALRRRSDRLVVVVPDHEAGGQEPLAALYLATTQAYEAALGRQAPPVTSVADAIAAARAWQPDRPDAGVVVVFDALERHLAEADPTLGAVATLAAAPRTVVVGVVRDDAEAALKRHPALARTPLAELTLRSMAPADLHRALAEPARRRGWTLEPALLRVLVAQAGADAQALPFVGLVMRVLAEAQANRRELRLADFEGLFGGGIDGVVQRQVEAALSAPTEAERRGLRLMLLAMMSLATPEGPVSARPLPRARVPREALPAVDRMVAARVLRARSGPDGGVVEVAHDAVLRGWDLAREVYADFRDLLRWRQRYRPVVEHWARTQDTGLLLHGTQLDEGRALLERLGEGMEAAEAELVGRSIEAAAAAARRWDTLARQAEAREQALEAEALLAEDPQEAVRVAARAVRLHADARTCSVLARALQQPRPRRAIEVRGGFYLDEERGRVGSLSPLAPDAREVRLVTSDHRLVQVDLETGETVDLVELGGLCDAAWSRDGGKVALLYALDAVAEPTWVAEGAPLEVRLSDGRLCGKARFQDGGAMIAAWSPAAEHLVVTTKGDGQVHLLGGTGAPLRRWTAHGGRVRAVAFSPDGAVLATAGEDGRVALWTITGRRVRSWATDSPAWALAWGPDGLLAGLVFRHGPGFSGVRLWSARGKLLAEQWLVRPRQLLWSDASGEPLLAVLGDDALWILQRAGRGAWEVVPRYSPGEDRPARSAAWAPDGHALAVTTADGHLQRWDPHAGLLSDAPTGRTGLADVQWPDDGRILLAGADGRIGVWPRRVGPLWEHPAAASSVVWTGDGEALVLAGTSGPVVILGRRGELRASVPGPHATAVTAEPAGASILEQTFRGHFLVHHLDAQGAATARSLPTPPAGEHTVQAWFAGTPAQPMFRDFETGVLYRWDGAGWAAYPTRLKGQVWTLASHPLHPERIALCVPTLPVERIAVVDLERGSATDLGPTGARGWAGRTLNALQWSPDGRWLAAASPAGWVRLLAPVEGRTCELHRHLGGPSDQDRWTQPVRGATAVPWSSDSRCLATGDGRGVVRLWSVGEESVDEIFSFTAANGEPITTIAWHPDGQSLVTVGRTTRAWPSSAEALLNLADSGG